jgi:hypothetical protein
MLAMFLVRITPILATGVVFSALASCDFTAGRDQAAVIAERYFVAAKSGDMNGVLALYSERFYKATSRESWRNFLNDVHARCGVPKSHSLATWNVANMIGTNSGTRATLVYSVQYSSCSASETMTIFIPEGKEGKIEGHFVKIEPLSPDNKVPATQVAELPRRIKAAA